MFKKLFFLVSFSLMVPALELEDPIDTHMRNECNVHDIVCYCNGEEYKVVNFSIDKNTGKLICNLERPWNESRTFCDREKSQGTFSGTCGNVFKCVWKCGKSWLSLIEYASNHPYIFCVINVMVYRILPPSVQSVVYSMLKTVSIKAVKFGYSFAKDVMANVFGGAEFVAKETVKRMFPLFLGKFL